jgi:hypothetical protein
MNLIHKIYKVFHKVVDSITTFIASMVLSSVIGIFIILSTDIYELFKMTGRTTLSLFDKIKNIFKPKQTLQEEQVEYMQSQVSAIMASMQSMMDSSIAGSGNTEDRYIRGSFGRLISPGLLETTHPTGPAPPIDPIQPERIDMLHISARNQIRATRLTDGDISIIYTDRGAIELPKETTLDDTKKPSEEIEGWWEE